MNSGLGLSGQPLSSSDRAQGSTAQGSCGAHISEKSWSPALSGSQTLDVPGAVAFPSATLRREEWLAFSLTCVYNQLADGTSALRSGDAIGERNPTSLVSCRITDLPPIFPVLFLRVLDPRSCMALSSLSGFNENQPIS